ncbi:MAG: hypothetical protein U5K74_00865 [Gemmatimonadaceae bacterium]|nr:hypothetical protein [Gemmatimonadaceae bacterium]
MIRRAWVVPTALMAVATVAFPCGGSLSYDVDGPLTSAESFVERALYPRFDMLDNLTRDEIRFLPGLLRADSATFAGLIGRAPLQAAWWDTTTKPRVAEPSARGIEAAWVRGDVDGAMRASSQVVATVMSLPFAEDSARDAAFRLAVETIEIGPVVVATRRRASCSVSGAGAADARAALRRAALTAAGKCRIAAACVTGVRRVAWGRAHRRAGRYA